MSRLCSPSSGVGADRHRCAREVERRAGVALAADVGVVPLDDEAARREVLVEHEVAVRERRAGGDADRLQLLGRDERRARRRPAAEGGVDVVVGGGPRGVVGVGERHQRVVAQEVDERPPLGVARDRDGDPRVGAVAAVHALRGVVVASGCRGAAGAAPVVLAASTDSPANASNVSSCERSTCTAAVRQLALPERGQQGERAVQPADGVGEREPDAQRLLADVAGGGGEPGVGLEHRAVRRVRRHRAGLAVAGHGDGRDAVVAARARCSGSMPSERAPRGV